MSESCRCPKCGAPLPADSPAGLCPNCLVAAGQESEPATSDEAATSLYQPPSPEKLGTMVGHYKLLQQIGEGGFGVVYMAEQTEPVRRKVALKIIKPGMDTKQVIARFEAERQALALMDHPNIASVLDAGSTDEGRPYFVMELVRGIPITQFCDDNSLTTSERLELFITVCNAIQHAHQKGVIHRDIKPTNVMVTLHDGVPVPKVIDFGVAKATQQQLTERTMFTAYGQMVGTPQYMSPEQAEMSGLDVDTRSDIYSLGVLLYELLTGSPPLDSERLRSAGYTEMQRMIREEEPHKPSTKISTLGEATIEVVSHRGTDAKKLAALLRGDLDWIVMRALEKNRNRRYETANGLALDIQRHINNEPVIARPPSTMYRLSKLASRNKAAFAATVGIIGSLAAGLAFATWGYVEADRQRGIARTAQADAEHDRDAARTAQEHAETEKLRAEAAEEDANESAQLAHKENESARRHLYGAHLLLARQDWENGRAGRLRDLLDAHRPQAGEQDLRGWEWYYLEALLHRDVRTLSEHEGTVYSISWNSDGSRLASAGDDQTLIIWDANSGNLLRRWSAHDGPIRCVAWSPDGRRLASASTDRTTKIWNAETGEFEKIFTGSGGPELAVAWSPDGRLLAGIPEDQTIRVWNVESGEQSYSASAPHRIMSLDWSKDGQRIAAGHSTGCVTVWNVTTEEQEYHQHEPLGFARSVAWSPDGKLLASTTDHLTVQIRGVETGKVVTGLRDHKGPVSSVAWSPDGHRLASTGEDQTIRIWDWETRQVAATLLGHSGHVRSVVWHPDGDLLATSGDDGTVKIWDPDRSLEAFLTHQFTNWVSAISWRPDGQQLATAFFRNNVEIWSPITGEKLGMLSGRRPRIWTVAWSPDGRQLATGNYDNTVMIWDAQTGAATQTLKGHQQLVVSVAWSPQGKQFASASKDSSVILWDVASGEALTTVQGYRTEGSDDALAWDPNGRFLAWPQNDGTLRVWDTIKKQNVAILPGHPKGVDSVAWHPDGSQLVAGCANGTIQLWDPGQQKKLFSIRGHTSGVRSIDFSPNGERIAAGGWDGTVSVRDAHNGEEVLTLRGHDAQVFTVAWSPDGKRLASGSFDKTVRVWDASRGHEEIDAQSDRDLINRVERLRNAGKVDTAEKRIREALLSHVFPGKKLWRLWYEISVVDLGHDVKSVVANWPNVDSAKLVGHAKDIQWILEQLSENRGVRISCGGKPYRSSTGTMWSHDRFFLTGARYSDASRVSEISGTPDKELYLSERNFPYVASSGYQFPLPYGKYRIKLHFAETSSSLNYAGSRRFHVFLEGEQVLTDYEPLAAGFATADVKSFDVLVNDGYLDVDFARGSADNPKICAIEIQPLDLASKSRTTTRSTSDE